MPRVVPLHADAGSRTIVLLINTQLDRVLTMPSSAKGVTRSVEVQTGREKHQQMQSVNACRRRSRRPTAGMMRTRLSCVTPVVLSQPRPWPPSPRYQCSYASQPTVGASLTLKYSSARTSLPQSKRAAYFLVRNLATEPLPQLAAASFRLSTLQELHRYLVTSPEIS